MNTLFLNPAQAAELRKALEGVEGTKGAVQIQQEDLLTSGERSGWVGVQVEKRITIIDNDGISLVRS